MKTILKKLFLAGILFNAFFFIKADQKVTVINFTDTAYALVKQPGGIANMITKIPPFQLTTSMMSSEPVLNLFATPHETINDKLKQNRSLQIVKTGNKPIVLAIEQTGNGTTKLNQINQTGEHDVIVINNKTDEQLLLRLELPETNIWKASEMGFGEKKVTQSEYPTFLYYTIPQKQIITIDRPDLLINTKQTLKNAKLQDLKCMLKIITPESSQSGIAQSFGFQESNKVQFNQNIKTEFNQTQKKSMTTSDDIIAKNIKGDNNIPIAREVIFSVKAKEANGVSVFVVGYQIEGNTDSSYSLEKNHIKLEKLLIP